MLNAILRRLRRSPEGTAEVGLARKALWPESPMQPWSPDDLVRSKGLDIYDRMQTDSQVAACLTTKKFAVLAGGWRLEPAGEDTQARDVAEFCHYALQEMKGSVQDTLFAVLDALAKGYSISEINFAPVREGRWKGRIGLHSIKHKDPSLFDFRTDGFLNITGLVRVASDGHDEQKLPVEKFIIYTYMPTYEDPRGRSDLRACYRHWWVKEIIQRFLAVHLERHGSPVVKGTYRRGLTRQQQEDLLRVLEGIQPESAIVVPEDVTVELMQSALRGDLGFLDALSYHDRQIAKAILGETLTQEEGQRTGALALARVHQDTFELRLGKLRRDLEETVMREQVLRPLVRLNFPGAAAPRFVLEEGRGKENVPAAAVG